MNTCVQIIKPCSVRCSTCTARLNDRGVIFKRKRKAKKIIFHQKEKKEKKEKKQNETKNAFIWLQGCFLEDVRVIWCNSLGDSHFQANVIDDVEIFLITIYISPFLYLVHILVTHKSMLNLVYMIVC